MKYLYSGAKKIVLSFFVLYSYNIIAEGFNLVIPINVITVLLVSFLGFPALFSLVLLFILVY